MNNQKQFEDFTYNTKCNIWTVSFNNTDKEYALKDYYSDEYNITIYDNDKMYNGICINELNRYYGELCTMYYVWKNNLKSDIVGFDQYAKHWQEINYNNINDNQIQTWMHFEENSKIIQCPELRSFIYDFILYIKFNFPEYKDNIDNLLFNYDKTIKDHINIFICKWEIFEKICNIIFGYLEHIMPNEQWQNENIIQEYIDFNFKYNNNVNLNNFEARFNSKRQFMFLLEFFNGTLYNIISKSFNEGLLEYYVVYNCETINDYNNILKLYKYNLGNGIRYVLINDINNIFADKFYDNNYEYKYLFLYDSPYLINDTCNDFFDIAKTNYLEEIKKYGVKIELNTNEYIYADSSIELNKGNYIIKSI